MVMPAAGCGAAPGAHPRASATSTVGMSEEVGGGSAGRGPVPADTGSIADEPHPPSAMTAAIQSVVAGSTYRETLMGHSRQESDVRSRARIRSADVMLVDPPVARVGADRRETVHTVVAYRR